MKKIIALFLFVGIVGCSSNKANFYQPIEVKEPKVSYNNFKDTVRINPIMLPQLVARPQITTLGDDDVELNIDEFNRWGAPLDKLIAQVINDNLSNIFSEAIIVNHSSFRKNYKFDVTVEFKNINGRLGEFAKIDAVYYIKDKNQKVIKSNNFYKTNTFKGGYIEYVKNISAILGELSETIANDLVSIK
ncbi:MAG: membrane integrity-associated transporter subunit PqiC [Alphaproteobacteria bacterium]|nr:membrane integrity-associated transporter subunit PqiC [Alphaproteobacteria bacterium]